MCILNTYFTHWVAMIIKNMKLMLRNSKVHVFVTFMLEDKHMFSFGMLIHLKCIHELCCLIHDVA
jgi:hypothetical protein